MESKLKFKTRFQCYFTIAGLGQLLYVNGMSCVGVTASTEEFAEAESRQLSADE